MHLGLLGFDVRSDRHGANVTIVLHAVAEPTEAIALD